MPGLHSSICNFFPSVLKRVVGSKRHGIKVLDNELLDSLFVETDSKKHFLSCLYLLANAVTAALREKYEWCNSRLELVQKKVLEDMIKELFLKWKSLQRVVSELKEILRILGSRRLEDRDSRSRSRQRLNRRKLQSRDGCVAKF